MIEHPRVGIVVIGRNEGERLISALRSVIAPGHDIVYVDSNSNDDSVAAARRAGAKVITLDMSKPFSAARARNAGYAALSEYPQKCEFVQFMDGDCELDRSWIEKAALFLRSNPNAAIACGRRRERFPERSIYNRLCDIEWDTPVGQTQECGGDFLVRSEAFSSVAGFRDALIAGEEPELCARLRGKGWTIWRIDAEMTRHDANMLHWWQWWRRSVRCGYCYAALYRLHGNGQDKLKRRNLISSLFWGAALPIAIVSAALFYPPLIAGLGVYFIQIVRIGLQRSNGVRNGASYGASLMIAKFAECVGIGKFILAELKGTTQPLIEYK